MNLADALRQASLRTDEPEAKVEEPELRIEEGGASAPPPSLGPGSPTTVRLELHLSPEQLASLFRSVLAKGHTVMTLKEVSALLRVDTSTLERMAESRELPAFLVDGRWRFPRAGVEDWLAARLASPQ
jgi:excisionase family DNA binding protein